MDEFSKCFVVGSWRGSEPLRHSCWSAHSAPREGGFFRRADDDDGCGDDDDDYFDSNNPPINNLKQITINIDAWIMNKNVWKSIQIKLNFVQRINCCVVEYKYGGI